MNTDLKQEILNPEETKKMILGRWEYLIEKLDISDRKLSITDFYGNNLLYTFEYAKKTLDKWYQEEKYPIVCQNALSIIGSFPIELRKIKEELIPIFEDIMQLYHKMYLAIKNQEEELSLKSEELQQALDKYQELKDTINKDQFQYLNSKIDMLSNMLIGKTQTPELKNTEKYFKETTKSPLQEEDDEPMDVQQIDKRQLHHSKVLQLMKDEKMYPLHKQPNPEQIKEQYKNFWIFDCNQHNLDIDDYPKSIDRLEEYQNEPDNYLDIVRD